MNRPVITAWSAVSPFGLGPRAFADGVRSGATGVIELDRAQWPAPGERAAPVPGFDVREVLGRKGTRALDRVSALTLATVADLMAASGRNGEVATGTGAGLVLGTTIGSAKSMMDITRDSLTQDRPYLIDTARIPNAIMNSATAQCAIRHQLRGPNTTVAGGRAAGLYALRYALRLLAAGRARTVLFGGAEELTAERAWLDRHGRAPGAAADPLGEGCALFLLEAGPEAYAGQAAPVLAEVLRVELAVHLGDGLAGAAGALLGRAMTRAGVRPEELWAVSPAGAAGWDDAVRAAAAAPGRPEPLRLPGDEAWGDAGAATAAFQLASVLAAAEHDPAATGRVAVITSYDQDGALGCALVRVLGPGTGERRV